MDWKEIYKNRVTTAEKAVKVINDDDNVVFSDKAGIPQLIIKALGERSYLVRDSEKVAKHSVVDVAVVSVSNPDNEGYCSFGVSCDFEAAKKAKIVIAEMNEMTPHTFGPLNRIHVSELDYIVHCAYHLPEYKPAIGELEKQIAQNCATLIPDGACLRLGTDAISQAVLLFLGDKFDLGIHTEMLSDGIVDLLGGGAVNNTKKNLHKGKVIASYIQGTRKLYNFVDNNTRIALYPLDYVNDPGVVARNGNVFSINSDVNADPMGISILAVPSAAVTVPTANVDYLVTELGITKMKDKK